MNDEYSEELVRANLELKSFLSDVVNEFYKKFDLSIIEIKFTPNIKDGVMIGNKVDFTFKAT